MWFRNVVRGSYLVSEGSTKNWLFILFVSFLGLIMISSSHLVSKKVHRITKLNAEVKELKSEYVDTRMRFMQSKLESRIISAMEVKGLRPSTMPPQRIRIVNMELEEYVDETRVAVIEN